MRTGASGPNGRWRLVTLGLLACAATGCVQDDCGRGTPCPGDLVCVEQFIFNSCARPSVLSGGPLDRADSHAVQPLDGGRDDDRGSLDDARIPAQGDASADDPDAGSPDAGSPDAGSPDAAADAAPEPDPDAFVGVDAAPDDAAADAQGTPPPERCNGLDDDGDGVVDEIAADDVPVAEAMSDGSPLPPICQRARRVCRDGAWRDPTAADLAAQAEAAGWHSFTAGLDVCNGADNDCDGATDEDPPMVPANRQSGVCAGALKVCRDGRLFEPDYAALGFIEAEVRCDGLDEDCDGAVDEGGLSESCRTVFDAAYADDPQLAEQNRSVCRAGVAECVPDGMGDVGPCLGETAPGAEICANGADDDCDGWTDEGCHGGPCRYDCPEGQAACPDPAPCPDAAPGAPPSTCVGDVANGRCAFALDQGEPAGCGCTPCFRLPIGGETAAAPEVCQPCLDRIAACEAVGGLCVSHLFGAADQCRIRCMVDEDCRPGWVCADAQSVPAPGPRWMYFDAGDPAQLRLPDLPRGTRVCAPLGGDAGFPEGVGP